MCGITGFVDKWDASNVRRDDDRARLLERMCAVIRHRGPDDQGVLLQPGVSLGMRRLSIIDLTGGNQPISNEDETITIVFNGEIYNYRDLQATLKSRGHRFKTSSDTETIIHAYEEYGPSCVNQLRGMFALAIWDENQQTLFITRDRVGKKPLYYSITKSGTFVFGSELKAILEHPEVERDTNPRALDAYFSLGYVPDPLSIFKNIEKLPPGHWLTFHCGRLSVERYWDFQYHTNGNGHTAADYLDELRSLIEESVKLRMVSDVPLGAFLSGGVDSSTVVGLMSQQMDQPVKTFSIGFNEDSFSELKYARLTSERFHTEHHEFLVTPDICEVVDQLVWHFDEPFADSSAIPTYVVSKLAREHVKVVLTGDGGDELFAGYTRYLTEQRRGKFDLLPRFVRDGFMNPLSRNLPHSTWGRNYLHNVSLDPITRYLDNVSVFSGLIKGSLYTAGFREQLKDGSHLRAYFRELSSNVRTTAELDSLLYIDSKTYLPGDILTKVDRMSMAASLEARVPLLDHKLIEFVTRIPAGLKMAGTETKHLFKQAIADLVPSQILNRPKQGFGVPIEHWINQQLRERMRDTLTDSRTARRGYVTQQYVKVLLAEHERGRRDHSMALWALLMLELWQRQYVDNAPHIQPRICASTCGAEQTMRTLS